ncbi:MAG: glycosyltransferase, partial [Flavobacteriales bacterium]|nr:glycosyltransferase [Flavobacteriales bacterium]
FNLKEYVGNNPIVSEAIDKGEVESAFDHYINTGVIDHLENDISITDTNRTETQNTIPEDISVCSPLDVPLFDTPVVSIIIPVYNQANYSYSCVEYIIKNTNVPFEVIIMDDNSSDENAINLLDYIKNVQFIRNEENLGFLNNCNKGANLAKGKYVLFLNNDTNVQPEWLSSLVDLIESDDNIGMVGSKLIYPDGRQQEAGGIIWDDASGWNFGRLADPDMAEFNYVKEVDYISGAALMIRKDLWDTIGGFDKQYAPAYYEDTDLAFEVRKHGYKVLYQPKSVVVHFEGVSHGTDTESGIKQYQVVNHDKFFTKWKDVLENEHFANAQDVFLSRDRSSKKPHVLFVDHYLPHYDKDAGSKAASQYLQILVNAGMQVHFIGDNFWHYPDTPYLNSLTDQGIEVLCGNWYAENWQQWLIDNGKYFDYVILSRPHISVKYIDIIKECSDAKIIYLGHDLHFLREEREYAIKQDESYLENSKKWKTQELDLISKSDVSYYFSDIEKTVIQEIDDKLNVDVVPLYIYERFEEIKYEAESRKDIMFVGGFSHRPNVDAVIWFVTEIFPAIKEANSDIHFHIIGSSPPEEIINLTCNEITVTGFVSDQKLSEYYSNIRLVIAPLRYGAGVKGKIIDSLYNGVPLVTTTIGAEGLSNPEEFMGLANTHDEFSFQVNKLYTDFKKLNELSALSNTYCQENFSTKFAKKQMANVITEFSS